MGPQYYIKFNKCARPLSDGGKWKKENTYSFNGAVLFSILYQCRKVQGLCYNLETFVPTFDSLIKKPSGPLKAQGLEFAHACMRCLL